MTDIKPRLETRDDLAAFTGEAARRLRALDFTGAERLIADVLAANPSPFAALCHAVPADRVAITGWEELFADIAQQAAKGVHVTAVGIDLSGHSEGDDPYFEVSLYDDKPFGFSATTRDEILAENERYATPWTGRFLDISGSLRCHGMNRIFDAMTAYEHRYTVTGPTLPEHFAGFAAVMWFAYLRVNQAVKREIDTRGMPHPMPVITGEHDFGDWFQNVHMATRVAEDRGSNARIADARRAEQVARFLADLERQVNSYRDARRTIRGFTGFFRTAEQRRYIDFSLAREKSDQKFLGFTTPRPSWKLSDGDFEAYLDRYRAAFKRNSVAGQQLFGERA